MSPARIPFPGLKAADLMSRDVVRIPEELPLREAARLLIRNQVTGAPVVDGQGICVGVLSAADFLHLAEKRDDLMRPAAPPLPITCSFQRKRQTREDGVMVLCTLPPGVCPIQRRQTDPAGSETVICSEPHCVPVDWQLVEMENLPTDEVRAFMTADPVTVTPDTPLRALARQMIDAQIHRVIVVDAQRRPIGVVSTTDIAAVVAYAEGSNEVGYEQPPRGLGIQIDRRAKRVVVHCTGDLDASGASELLRAMEPLGREGELPVVLDLSGVRQVGNEGVQALHRLFEEAAHRQAGIAPNGPLLLRLANVPARVRATLEASDFTERLAGWSGTASQRGREAGRTYRSLLPHVRAVFPSPVSDPRHDEYLVQSVTRALDRIDQLKCGKPYLGEPLQLDYATARAAKLPDEMSSQEEAISAVADYLHGHVLWGHPHTQEQVIPPPTIASVLGQMFGALFNPNLLWDAYSHRVAQAEVELTAMCAGLVGYEPAKAGGLSTFGGTGTELYGVKIGVEKAQPGAFHAGVRGNLKVVCSDVSHHCRLNVAAWLGLGTDSVVTVPTDDDNAMSLPGLEAVLRGILERGEQVACIIATMGSTDAFGLDPLEAIVQLRDRLAAEYRLPYRPHVHADAVIGWPWAVFNDYDFAANPLDFSTRTLRSLWDARTALRGLHLADSIGLDFHKTGYGPIASSLFLCKDHADLQLISRDPALMPYLFQFGSHRPGIYTLETSRAGSAVLAALANLKLLGKEGYRVLLGHIVTMAEVLRAKLERATYARVVNDANHGMVTLFRVYPEGIDANRAYHEETTQPDKAAQLLVHNAYNRRVFEALRRQVERGEGMNLGMTDQYRVTPFGTPITALKSFVMSPFVDEAAMDYLLACVERAQAEVAEQAETTADGRTPGRADSAEVLAEPVPGGARAMRGQPDRGEVPSLCPARSSPQSADEVIVADQESG